MTEWTKERLVSNYGDVNFVVGGVGISLKLKDFFTYCGQAREESPLYLFDRDYPTKAPNMLNEYTIPEYFKGKLSYLHVSYNAGSDLVFASRGFLRLIARG